MNAYKDTVLARLARLERSVLSSAWQSKVNRDLAALKEADTKSAAQEQVTGLQSATNEVAQTAADLASTVTKLNTVIDQLAKRVAKLETDSTSNAGTVNALSKDLKAVQATLSKLPTGLLK